MRIRRRIVRSLGCERCWSWLIYFNGIGESCSSASGDGQLWSLIIVGFLARLGFNAGIIVGLKVNKAVHALFLGII